MNRRDCFPPGEPYALLFKSRRHQKSDDDLHTHKARKRAGYGWLSQHELPLDTHVVLKSEPGLLSALGPEPSVTSSEIVQFDTILPLPSLASPAQQTPMNRY
jgi:hypothetical protein